MSTAVILAAQFPRRNATVHGATLSLLATPWWEKSRTTSPPGCRSPGLYGGCHLHSTCARAQCVHASVSPQLCPSCRPAPTKGGLLNAGEQERWVTVMVMTIRWLLRRITFRASAVVDHRLDTASVFRPSIWTSSCT